MTHISKLTLVFSSTLVSAAPLMVRVAHAEMKWPKPAIVHLRERLKSGHCALQTDKKAQQDICTAYSSKTSLQNRMPFKVSQPNESLLILESRSHIIKVARGMSAGEFAVNSTRLSLRNSHSHAEIKAQIEKALAIKSARRSLWIEVAEAGDAELNAVSAVHQLVVETNQMEYCQLLTDFGDSCVKGMQQVLNGVEGRGEGQDAAAKLKVGLSELRKKMAGNIMPSLYGYDSIRMCAFQKDMSKADEIQANAEKKLTTCNELVKRLETLVQRRGLPDKNQITGIRQILEDVMGTKMASNLKSESIPTIEADSRQ